MGPGVSHLTQNPRLPESQGKVATKTSSRHLLLRGAREDCRCTENRISKTSRKEAGVRIFTGLLGERIERERITSPSINKTCYKVSPSPSAPPHPRLPSGPLTDEETHQGRPSPLGSQRPSSVSWVPPRHQSPTDFRERLERHFHSLTGGPRRTDPLRYPCPAVSSLSGKGAKHRLFRGVKVR